MKHLPEQIKPMAFLTFQARFTDLQTR